MPKLEIKIVEAKNLPDVQTFGKIDPFVTVELENKQWKSDVVENEQNPVWNNIFKFMVADADSSQLKFVVWNKNAFSNDFLGEYRMSISNLTRGEIDDKWVLLQNCKANAELRIRMRAVDFGDLPDEEKEDETPCHTEERYAAPEMQYNWAANPAQYQAPPQNYAPPPPPQVQYPEAGGVYQLSPRHAPHLVLDVGACSTDNGAKLILWENNGGNNQKWVLVPRDSGFVSFLPTHASDKALDFCDKGHDAIIWEQGDGNNHNQHWMLEPTDSGFFAMKKRRQMELCLDVAQHNTNPGAKLCGWDFLGGPNQQWRFTRVG